MIVRPENVVAELSDKVLVRANWQVLSFEIKFV